jgi:hypothetical protein
MSTRTPPAVAAIMLLVLGALGFTSTALAAPRTTERTFPAPEPGLLTLTAKHGGDIRIAGWDKPEIHVLVTDKKGNIKIDFRPSGGNLTIEGAYEGSKQIIRSTEIVYDIQIPRKFDLSIASDGGDILLEGIEGKIQGRTMGGNLRLAELAGTIDLETKGGNIEAAQLRATGPLRTAGGNVSIANAPAGVDVATMGGNIRIGPVDGPVKATTMGGSIEIRLGPGAGDCTATTAGGDITLQVPAGYSATFLASIADMPDAEGVECKVPGLDLAGSAKLGDGGHRVALQTGGGRLRILPAE